MKGNSSKYNDSYKHTMDQYEWCCFKDLEKRKDKALVRTDTDNLWTKIESLQWVLFVLFAIRNGKMVIV